MCENDEEEGGVVVVVVVVVMVVMEKQVKGKRWNSGNERERGTEGREQRGRGR